jgi:hypothetical protein
MDKVSKGSVKTKQVAWRPEWEVVDFEVKNLKFNPDPNTLVQWDCIIGECYATPQNEFFLIRNGDLMEMCGSVLRDIIQNLSVEEYTEWCRRVYHHER